MKNTGTVNDESGYRQFVGKALYAVLRDLPECSNAIRDQSSHLASPDDLHWKALLRMMGYLKHHYEPMKIRTPHSLRVISFYDSDWATSTDDRRSISSLITTLGGNTVLNWSSKKQTSTALSSCEAETVAASLTVQDILFICNVLEEIF